MTFNYILLLLLTILVQSSTSFNITTLLFFGDSLLDTGNNDYLPTTLRADHLPYGRDFPGGISTGRFSNGLMIPDLLANKLGIKQFVPPYHDPKLAANELLTGVNFASAGAGYDDMTSTITVGTMPVGTQVGDSFNQYVGKLKAMLQGEAATLAMLGDAVAMFSSGSNDLAVNFFGLPGPRRAQFNVDKYQDFLLQNMQGAIKKLYDNGIRKFIVAGLPPIMCMPANIYSGAGSPWTTGQCLLEQVSLSTTYNTKLQKSLAQAQASLNGSKLVYLDFHDNILDMINNPSKYGFTETGRGCCGTGRFEAGALCNSFTPSCPEANTFVFFDVVHPTEKVYSYITDQIMSTILPQFH